MKAFIGVTDNDWYQFLSRRAELEEANVWSPEGNWPDKENGTDG